jgi:ABC-type sugar transport systems, permease components
VKSTDRRDIPYLFFVLPAIVYVGYFAFYPSFSGVYRSFLSPHGGFTLNNYNEMLYYNLGAAILNTLIVSFGALIIQLFLGLVVASILVWEFRGKKLFSTVTIIPMGIATVVAAIAYSFIFEPRGGYANTLLHALGLGGINWYSSTPLSLLVVMVADSWKNTPIFTLILLAGLSSIPRDLYHAAALDGAGVFNRFVHVTLPNMRKFIAIALIIRGVQEFNIFALPLILIGEHPPLLTTFVYDLYSTSPTVYISLAAATILLALMTVFIALNIAMGGRR